MCRKINLCLKLTEQSNNNICEESEINICQYNTTTSTQENTITFNENEQTLQDNLIDTELLKMGLKNNNEETIQSTLCTEELINILEDEKESDSENVEDTFIIDNNKSDDLSIKSIDTIGNCIMNFSYVCVQKIA